MPTTLEKMMQQAAIDPDFRAESKKFGVNRLPEAVQAQDQHFFEMLNDGLESIGMLNGCGASCSSGPFTIVCDGSTK